MEKTIISKIVNSVESSSLKFTPSKEFYEQIKINKKRFAQLKRGEKSPTLIELKNLCEFFKLELKNYIV